MTGFDNKSAARRRAKEERRRLTQAQVFEKSLLIADRLLSLPEIRGAKTVLSYISFGAEADTTPVIEGLWKAGVTVLAPRVAVDGTMEGVVFSSFLDLVPGYRGIKEPPYGTVIDKKDIDAILVPGLFFDRQGYRVGYGGGFYDRYLSGCRGTRVGLCFHKFLAPPLPSDEWDERVHIIVTDREVVRTDDETS